MSEENYYRPPPPAQDRWQGVQFVLTSTIFIYVPTYLGSSILGDWGLTRIYGASLDRYGSPYLMASDICWLYSFLYISTFYILT